LERVAAAGGREYRRRKGETNRREEVKSFGGVEKCAAGGGKWREGVKSFGRVEKYAAGSRRARCGWRGAIWRETN
jgi:hypothetical protein